MKLKKVLPWIGGPIVLLASIASVVAARYEPTIRPNTFAGPVDISRLTHDEAAKKIREWWLSVKATPITVLVKNREVGIGRLSASQLDTLVDDQATVDAAPVDTPVEGAQHTFEQGDAQRNNVELKFKSAGEDMARLESAVLAASHPQPAKFGYISGQVYSKPEVAGYVLDVDSLPATVGKAVVDGTPVVLPVHDAPERVTAHDAAEITDLISTYTTHFPHSPNRNNNIRMAAGKLNDIFLRPGERLSFNLTVGRRTIQAGFKDAPVFKNGKHDHGVGGGICQVSTTLYNASLLGDLKIVRRSNHSLPVAYVPLGRDATVDYGSKDLVIENNYATPIVVLSACEKRSLTFRILGKRDPDLAVKILRTGEASFSAGVEYVNDPKLLPGQTRVIDRGSTGRAVTTYRLIYRAGKLVERQPLGRSYYKAAKRIVGRGPSLASSPAQVAPPSAPAIRG